MWFWKALLKTTERVDPEGWSWNGKGEQELVPA